VPVHGHKRWETLLTFRNLVASSSSTFCRQVMVGGNNEIENLLAPSYQANQSFTNSADIESKLWQHVSE
jgi:hypothetical protein